MVAAAGVNVAVTLWLAPMLSEHETAVPRQSPLQPVKTDPLEAAAIKVTCVVLSRVTWQLLLQD